MILPHTEVKFYPEVKSQIGLSSLRISCKRALRFPQEISSPPPQMRMRPVNVLHCSTLLVLPKN